MGAYKIASSVRQHGYSAQVIDHVNIIDLETLYETTKRFITKDTSIIGISTTWMLFANHTWPDGRRSVIPWNVHECMRRLRNEHPSIMFVAGGYRANLSGEQFMIDAVVNGYGEATFVDLLEHKKGYIDEPIFELRPSFHSNDVVRKVYTAPRRARHDIQCDGHLFSKQDCIQPGETLPIEISRGCVFKCKFCRHRLLGRKKLDYLRSFEMVKRELIHNYENWNVTNYYVLCDTFNDTPTKMKMWHDMVTSLPFKIRFHAYIRTDLLERYEDTPHQLLESGLWGSFHGIESFGEQASMVIGKGWSGKHAKQYLPRLLNDTWKGKVKASISFIAGLPGDTREMLLETVDWLRDLDPYHAFFHTLTIKPETSDDEKSEFDRNHRSYGYEFEGPGQNWKLPYWDHEEAKKFTDTVLNPSLERFSSRIGSWNSIGLLGMDLDPKIFDKRWQRENTDELWTMLHLAMKRYDDRYLKDLGSI